MILLIPYDTHGFTRGLRALATYFFLGQMNMVPSI